MTEASQDQPRQRMVRSEGARMRRSVGPEESALKDAFRQVLDPELAAFDGLPGQFRIIRPPFNPASLVKLPAENFVLSQCIDAVVTNVCGHGWRLEYVGDRAAQESAESVRQQRVLQTVCMAPNPENDLTETCRRVLTDKQTMGFGYFEVARDDQNAVVGLKHIPAHTVRKTYVETAPVTVLQEVVLPDGFVVELVRQRNFRRYVQIVNEKRIFFKEFGDPRAIDPANGAPNPGLGLAGSATEVVELSRYVSGQSYGMPAWIGQLPAVMGSRQAELTNTDFFTENAVPALALLISGGMVTQASIDELEARIASVRGRKSVNRVMVLEVEGDQLAAGPDGRIPAPSVELKPLGGDRQSDMLFGNYLDNCATMIRSAFRLPPIFVGMGQDYTYASAKTSFEVGESQVFGPERQGLETVLDTVLAHTNKVTLWRVRMLPPRITDPDTIAKLLPVLEAAGAMTPNAAILVARDLLGIELAHIDAPWGEFPFDAILQMLRRGVIVPIDEAAQVIRDGIGMVYDPGGTASATGKPIGGAAPPDASTKAATPETAQHVYQLLRHVAAALDYELVPVSVDRGLDASV